MSKLKDFDMEAVATAVRILSEAGYNVTESSKSKSKDNGVQFELEIYAPTRTRFFSKQSSAVKDASIDAPEFGLGGKEVDPE